MERDRQGWQKTFDPKVIQQRVLKQASRDGIILLHDLYPGTVPAVPGIIDALKERGYHVRDRAAAAGAGEGEARYRLPPFDGGTVSPVAPAVPGSRGR